MNNIAHIALIVRDYDEAIRFYTEKLDFDVIEDIDQKSENKRWVTIAPKNSQGCSVLLSRARNDEQAQAIGHQSGGRVFLFLATDDFERDYQKLQRRNVQFVRPAKCEDYGKVAVFKDLYGNLWDLIEFADGHPVASRL